MRSFLAFLGLMFIFLKLADFIDWSWWLVLLPPYSGAALVAGLMLLTFTLLGIEDLLRGKK